MTKKGEAEFGIGADAIKAVFGDCLNLSNSVGAQIGELGGLEIAKDLFGGIELRRCAGKAARCSECESRTTKE